MSTSGRILTGLTAPVRLAPLVAGCLVLLLGCAESTAQPPGAGETSTVRGKVDRFTTAPRGEADGAVLDDGTWLDCQPLMLARVSEIPEEGQRVAWTGRTRAGPG